MKLHFRCDNVVVHSNILIGKKCTCTHNYLYGLGKIAQISHWDQVRLRYLKVCFFFVQKSSCSLSTRVRTPAERNEDRLTARLVYLYPCVMEFESIARRVSSRYREPRKIRMVIL